MKSSIGTSIGVMMAAVVAATLPSSVVAQSFQAQPIDGQRILPRAISVDPVYPPYGSEGQMSVWLNRRGQNPQYYAGEAISISVQPNRDAYVYLYSVEANGRIQLIVPNSYAQAATYVRAGQVYTFPPQGSPFRLTVTPPYGQASVFALAAPRPLASSEVSYLERPGEITRLAKGVRTGQRIQIAPNRNPVTEQIQIAPNAGWTGQRIQIAPHSNPSIQRIQVDPVEPSNNWFTGSVSYRVR